MLALALPLAAQTQPDSLRPNWRRVGGPAIDLTLAAPATGPVSRVWFALDGARLYALTESGRTFESTDLETWTAVPNTMSVPDLAAATDLRTPEAGAKLFPHPRDARRIYAQGNQHLYRSDDGGASWTNITAFGEASVIGSRQRDIAVSPANPDLLIVANDLGVWRSADGGLSWTGLNQNLPNLPIRRLVATPSGMAGTRAIVDGIGLVEVQPGSDSDWKPLLDARLSADLVVEATRRRAFSQRLGAEITAAAGSGDIMYAGAADGRIWVSSDRGQTWRGPRPGAGTAVEAFFVDAQESRIALAALGGRGTHVLRTINTGVTWDDLSANLPDAPAHGIAVDRQSGAAYLATDAGVFYATVDLDRASPAGAWTRISSTLPEAPAVDVRLDPGANQLYVALDGYGVFSTIAPHRARQIRIVNAADFTARAAAPGSLVSVIGGRIGRAQAGGLSFPILDANDSESQIQVPFEAVSTADASIALLLDSTGRQITLGVPFQPVSPAIFVDRTGAPMLLDADSGMMIDTKNTLRSGARIQILTTGLGRVRPDWPTGMAAPLQQPPAVRATMGAFVDHAPLEVLSATLAPGYVGLYLVEIRLPAIVNAGPAELYVTADGQESNRVAILLEP